MDITWRPDFDLCTIFILILFAIFYYSRNRFVSLTGRLFGWMLIDLLAATVVEYVEVFFSHIVPIATPAWKLFLLCAYEILITLMVVTFSLYVFLNARKGSYTKGRLIWYLIYTPAAFTMLAIVTTPLTHFVSYYEEGHFHTGPFYYGVYVVLGLYMVYAGAVTVRFRTSLLRGNRISFLVFLCCAGIGMVYQAVTVGGLVANFCSSLGLILIYFTQQSNYDTLDESSNLFNKQALLMHVNELINSNQNFRLVALIPDRMIELLHSKGSYYTEELIRVIGERLREMYGYTGTYSLGGGRFAVISTDAWKDDIRKRLNEALEDTPVTVRGEEISLTTSGCYLQYPGDFETGEDALDLIAKGLDIASQEGKGTLVTIDNYEGIRDTIIARLKQEQQTLEREKEAAELAKETAESAARAKTTFLAHMSHEIRTPLTTIMGMTEILLRGTLSETARDKVGQINSASRSLLQIINDILDFSKIEAGKMEIVNDSYDVIPMIDSAVNVLRVRSDSKPIEVITDIDPDIPCRLVGDETRIRQVLFNLVSNAAKYTDAGTITFTIGWDPTDSSLRVEVKDTGRGISEADMENLFESFRRFDAHANKAIEGSGLGLTITKRIIDLMGGTLSVKSEYGQGSTFSVTLEQGVDDPRPISDPEVEEGMRKHEGGTELNCFIAPDAKILVVDDNSFNRTIAEELIKPHMITVDQAAGGQECIDKVRETHYDMIFLDHMMPGMDGFETIGHLQKLPGFTEQKIPVIAFTANAVTGMKEQFYNAGFRNLLTKPINIDALENMLIEYLPEDKIHRMSRQEFDERIRQASDNAKIAVFDMEKAGFTSVDTTEGLTHTSGDIDKYFKLIRVILNDRPAMVSRLTKEYEELDLENYTIDVHALKSNFASIGAIAASTLAKELEAAGRGQNTDFIKENHAVLMQKYSELNDELTKAVENYDRWLSVSASETDNELVAAIAEMIPDYSDCLECIRILIDECEYDTAIKLTELFSKFAEDEGHVEAFRQISDKLNMFDYDGATELIAGFEE